MEEVGTDSTTMEEMGTASRDRAVLRPMQGDAGITWMMTATSTGGEIKMMGTLGQTTDGTIALITTLGASTPKRPPRKTGQFHCLQTHVLKSMADLDYEKLILSQF